MTKELNWDFNC